MVQADIWQLYQLMLRSRFYENEIIKIWNDGKISGEMHMNIGEEAIIAGIISQLIEGDAIAIDHRGTAPFFMRGIDPVALLLEFMGHSKGICAGQGGHMHLFSKENLAASSGIVGASGPTATGFALTSIYKNKDNIAVAFFGEGAMNQGMLLESMNLASVWDLPVLFVCKSNKWSITTRSIDDVIGGNLIDRAKGFGIEGEEVDGMDVEAVWNLAHKFISDMRKNKKPYFIQAHCVHKEGHFLGDPLVQLHRTPVKVLSELSGPLIKSLLKIKGGSVTKRGGSLVKTLSLMKKSGEQLKKDLDPIVFTQNKLKKEKDRLKQIEDNVSTEIGQIIERTLKIFHGKVEGETQGGTV
ncbi:MAG: thiamine pyrophosphate-dependent dehydrogenase E1 component subunit alpha [archaeon]|nr:thiamine pyrophosphate-dependent dehydrogenase E1 component subunit alpha [archaeon]